MKENNKREKNLQTLAKEVIIAFADILIFFISWLLLSSHNILNTNRYLSYLGIYLTYIVCFLFFNSIYDAYAIGRRKISENAYSLSLSCIISSVVFYFLDTLAFRAFYSPWYAIVATLLQIIINIVYLKKANALYFKNYNKKDSLVVYRDEYDLSKLDNISFFDMKYNVKEKIQKPKSYKEIDKILDKYEVVFICGINATLRNGIIKSCINKDIEAYVIPHVGDVIISGGKYVEELAVPMVRIERSNLNPLYELGKRIFDIVVAGCATIILSPFMLLTALAIKLYDRGPVLYKQVRLTKDRKEFTILKFRSMRVDAEKDGVARLVSEKDDRITPIGKIIRAIRFDELPQVFNILKGDMSIVGPRPERPEIAEQYEKIYPSFKLRLQVKAGLTGYAQIYGKYNTEPIDKLKMDLYYINKMSFLYDIQLCFMTVKTLFMKESTAAVEEGKVTASKDRDNE